MTQREQQELQDARRFVGLRDDSDMSASGLRFGTAHELRVGRYCMVDNVPCRIRDIQRSAPGKHGHAKLRVTGVGVFDQRKRETLFVAHQQVQIPTIETRSNVICVPVDSVENADNDESGRWFAVKPNGDSLGLPGTLRLDDDDVSDKLGAVVLTVGVCCGHFYITAARPLSQEQEVTAATQKEGEDHNADGTLLVLSKKEQRKQRKKVLKQRQETQVAL